jgi:hypothetical protein
VSWRPREGEGRRFVDPALELAKGNEDLATAADDTELGEDVLLEEVERDADRLGRLGAGEGDAGEGRRLARQLRRTAHEPISEDRDTSVAVSDCPLTRIPPGAVA